jgi:hypothetical protein
MDSSDAALNRGRRGFGFSHGFVSVTDSTQIVTHVQPTGSYAPNRDYFEPRRS